MSDLDPVAVMSSQDRWTGIERRCDACSPSGLLAFDVDPLIGKIQLQNLPHWGYFLDGAPGERIRLRGSPTKRCEDGAKDCSTPVRVFPTPRLLCISVAITRGYWEL
jgi:hypothetical protein